MEPTFLSLGEVLEIHRDQLTRYGGAAGVHDWPLLLSALAQPRAAYGEQFLHADLYAMAAAYLFHIVQNHPWVDGNKRVGVVASIVFLALNGIEFDGPEDDLEALVTSVAQGRADKSAIADFFRRHAK